MAVADSTRDFAMSVVTPKLSALAGILMAVSLPALTGCDTPASGRYVGLDEVPLGKDLTMHDIVRHLYLVEGRDPLDPGVPVNEVEAAFSMEEDTPDAFLERFRRVSGSRRDNAMLAVYETRDAPVAALALTLSPGGEFVESLLLRYGMGNNEFRIERRFSQREDGEFELSDRRYDTEWTDVPTKGAMVLQQEKSFTITVDPSGHFHGAISRTGG